MLYHLINACLAAAALLGSPGGVADVAGVDGGADRIEIAPESVLEPLFPSGDDGRGTDFILDKCDSICGLDDPRQLTRPSRVDHAKLIAGTAQMQRMKREKINPSSAKGIQLRTEAAKLVSRACEKIRAQKKFCSVWKKIRRRDGKQIADITALVKRQLGR